ncbi:Hypoxia-inducible factor 1-alpha [Eumeta japonica]|uniref:Hypoxia-inducible factor 1-alpha n=1 Tax=Eumeta variegata TaxID=151549 RepID=A0A4C1Y045_EUMVA|nr:Hypoxia-inducible factor 1-alpha [Eumeta japonica]
MPRLTTEADRTTWFHHQGHRRCDVTCARARQWKMEIMGQSVFEFSHPCDHDEIREALRPAAKGEAGARRDLLLRLKCTITNKGRNVHLKSASYKVIRLTGHMLTPDKESSDPEKDNIDQESEIKKDVDEKKSLKTGSLIAVGRPIPHPANIEIPLDSKTFLSKHNLDMKFTYTDDSVMLDYLMMSSAEAIIDGSRTPWDSSLWTWLADRFTITTMPLTVQHSPSSLNHIVVIPTNSWHGHACVRPNATPGTETLGFSFDRRRLSSREAVRYCFVRTTSAASTVPRTHIHSECIGEIKHSVHAKAAGLLFECRKKNGDRAAPRSAAESSVGSRRG